MRKHPYTAVKYGAEISGCNRYRWSLWREWGEGPRVIFVMLNPSTADATYDDPTIRRCMSFAKREGAGSVEVVNLFAFRATDPLQLASAVDPEGGARGEAAILAALGRARLVVCAWGAAAIAKARVVWFLERFSSHDLKCLGVTRDGSPRHPLYVKAEAPIMSWPAVAHI